MNRRNFIQYTSALSLAMAFKPEWLFAQTPTIFELPALPYAYEALEPHFDTLTMQTHHTKHHAAYVKNLNEGIVGTKFEKMSLEEILANVTPAFAKIRNNAGGHYNHSFFWKTLTPQQNQKEPTGKLAQDIQAQFGSFEKFKQEFSAKATALFGSGWAWLAEHPKKGLFIESTPNQDNLLMKKIYKQTASPILGLDVWEHAYYLKYQNRRAEYIKAFWNLVDWENISKEYNNKR